MGLERIETKRGHKYVLDGMPIKGVTTLLGSGLPKPHLMYWSAKEVASFVVQNIDDVKTWINQNPAETMNILKNVPWQSRDRAAKRGTDIHAFAEAILHGGEVEVPAEISDYVQGYINWLDEWQVEPILTEKTVGSRRYKYAGTFDAILKFGSGPLKDKIYLCDWKTSNSVYGEMALQLSAYSNAEFYIDDDGNEQVLPLVDGLAIVHVKPGKTEVYTVNDEKYAFKSFLHVAELSEKLSIIEDLLDEAEAE